MGWTVFNQMPTGGLQAAVPESLSDFGKRELVASAMVLGVVYAAVRGGDEVIGAVGVIDGLGYKLMSECEGPYYYQAPPEVIEKLTPTDCLWSRKRPAKCAEPALNPGAA